MKYGLYLLVMLLMQLTPYGQPVAPSNKKSANSATILFDAFSKNATLTKGWGFSSLIEFGGKRIFCLMRAAMPTCSSKIFCTWVLI